MLSQTLKKVIYDALVTNFGTNVVIPKQTGSVTVVSVNIVYSNQFNMEIFPSIVLRYFDTSESSGLPLDNVHRTISEPSEEIEFAIGTDKYVLKYDYVASISEVTALVSSVETILDSSEYQLNQNYPSSGDEIEFLGPTYPDDVTDFTVKYLCNTVITRKGGEYQDKLSVNVYAMDYRDSGDTFINGTIIAEYLINEIKKYLQLTFSDDDIVFRGITPIRNLDALIEGGEHRRRQFDIIIAYHEEVEVTVENILTQVITTEVE